MFNEYLNKHQGERCFILGNAPSLLEEDLSLLKNEIVFIVNKGYKSLSLGLDHYNYYVLTDERVYNTDYEDIQKLINCPRFYSYKIQDNKNYIQGPNENFVPIKKVFLKKEGSLNIIKNKFPESFETGWGKTRSVVFDAAIIAFFMGFKEIYLLGVDLYHDATKPTHFYEPSSREENSRGELNTKIHTIEAVIKNLNSHFQENNVKFVNLSKGFKYKELMATATLGEILNEKDF